MNCNNFIKTPYMERVFGGTGQQDRMIADKRKTLDRAVLYSYQGALVKKEGMTKSVRALINPNKLKQDYDDKIISIRYDAGFTTGDVFEWENTNTHWIIYLQDLTELAYFKGDIRRCSYKVNWLNKDGQLKTTYMAVRGPVETKINTINQMHASRDVPNYSLSLLVPKNPDTLEYFQRYAKFYLQDADDITKKICWQIQAIDTISTPGIIEVIADEDYSNEFLDDIANGIIDGKVGPPIDPTPITEIQGETFIKPKISYTYIYTGQDDAVWSINPNLPVVILETKDNTIKLKWNTTYSGQFDLICNDSKKTIVVESLF